MQEQTRSGSRRLGTLLMLAGVVVFLGFGAGFSWVVLRAKAPGMNTLSQISGRVQAVESSEDAQAGRTVNVKIDQAGSLYTVTISRAEQLPVRDWPLGSLDRGDRVVAWYTPEDPSRSSGRLWQLLRGSLPVVKLEDTAAAHSSRARRPLPLIVVGLVAGAVLVAFGRILYKRTN
jgi:hypothetical protein